MNLRFKTRGRRLRKTDREYDEQVKLAFNCSETIVFHARVQNSVMEREFSVGPIRNIPAYHLFELLGIEPKKLEAIVMSDRPNGYIDRSDYSAYEGLDTFPLALAPFQKMAHILNRTIIIYAPYGRGEESFYAKVRPEEATDEYRNKHADDYNKVLSV